MKKIISITLTISLILSTFTLSVSAVDNVNKENSIENFIAGVTKMINDYGNADFTTPSISVEPNDEIVSEATIDETEDLTNFQTCRLIVQADYDFDTYNAIDVVSGFQNFHILQFDNEADTQTAYEKYVNDSNIISVDIDTVYNCFSEDYFYAEELAEIPKKEKFEKCWSLNITGMDSILNQLKDSCFQEIIVGVIDSGIDYNHEIFENRVIRTNFNNSGDGLENDEYDTYGHGTSVSSVIIKNSPQNVKVASYRIGTDSGKLTTTSAAAAILQALEDKIRIINCSFNIHGDYELFDELLLYARSLNCFVANSAGNGNLDSELYKTPFQKDDNAFIVASCDEFGIRATTSTKGKEVDIVAPGVQVYCAGTDNSYGTAKGTSFASPCIAGIYATLSSLHPELSLQEKERRLRASTNVLMEPYFEYIFPKGGIVNCIDLFDLDNLKAPIFSLDSGIYNGKVSIALQAESGSKIYYTTDGTYPSPKNGILYQENIEYVGEYFTIIAVAYKNGKRSNFSYETIHSAEIGTDETFTVTSNGIITNYSGDISYLKIPETINGVTVQNIAEGVFKETKITGIVLPDTMTTIGELSYFEGPATNSFIAENSSIEYISGKGIKTIGQNAFYFCKNLKSVDFPVCEQIGCYAFYATSLFGINMPSVTTLQSSAFDSAIKLRAAIFPNCTKILSATFLDCRELRYIYMPLADYNHDSEELSSKDLGYTNFGACDDFVNTFYLTTLDLPNMISYGYDRSYPGSVFDDSSIKRFELSKAQYLFSYPQPGSRYDGYVDKPIPVELSLPSSLVYCAPIDNFIDETQREYCVYGTKGTYAEQWAIENNITFYEITQETAIVENIEPFWDEYSYKSLEFDARGFNRTYQWYGSTDDIIGNDTPIIGATDKTFNPDDNKQYPYYYCVMNSKDIDVDGNIVSEVNITSAMCQNRLYYIYDTDKTSIDYTNLMIFTHNYAQTSIDNIVGIKETTTYYYRPSYIYRKTLYYGTGSTLDVCNDNGVWEAYTLIVQGDVNGDSVCDVIDAFEVQRASTAHTEITDNYLLAADTDFDGEISVYDYAQVVNMAVSKRYK